MEESAPTYTEEETTSSLSATDAGALGTLGNFACTIRKKGDGGTLGPTGTLTGSSLGQAVLRREKQDQMGSNNCENQATWKEGKADHRCHKHSPTPVGHSGQISLRREQCGTQTCH
jgi:hypothetical protein